MLANMARTTRASASKSSAVKQVANTAGSRSANRKVAKKEEPDVHVKREVTSSPTLKRAAPSTGTRSSKRIKTEDSGLLSPEESKPSRSPTPDSEPEVKTPKKTKGTKSSAEGLQAKKLKQYAAYSGQSPFPDFLHPTPEECKLAHRILSKLHGKRERPKEVVANQDRAGCGDSPSVLDALVRTILSQNTSDKNSTRAKKSMDAVYGGSDKWDVIAAGGEKKLEESIKCGGLSQTKSKVIMSILNQTKETYGKYSLDHLFDVSNEEAMREMISMKGVGPKTASCVLLFCLQRESFAVDTHVHRITGLLGWRPKNADREQTHAHLDIRVPDEDKYGLHILLVSHGKKCDECRAGGKNLGKCELRKAFRKGKLEGEAGDEVKEEEVDQVKKEEDEDD